jgi:hypothetical protein
VTDPRDALRAAYAHWLRVRANVRALATKLAAAEFAAQRDARRSGDRDMTALAAQLTAERLAMETLGRELDARIAQVKSGCDAIEAGYIESLAGAARLPRGTR